MNKIFSLILLILLFGISNIVLAHNNTVDNSPSKMASDCKNLINDKQHKKDNPGDYYFRVAVFCEFISITNEDQFNKVINLLNESASYNYTPANYALGRIYLDKYESGSFLFGVKGKPEDILLAIKNFEIAEKEGSAWAQNQLAEIYLSRANLNKDHQISKDVSDTDAPIPLPDIKKAIFWFEKAAHNGQPAAQGSLGELYKLGLGIPQDFVEAYVWQNISVASQSQFNPHMSKNTGREMLQFEQDERNELYKQLTTKQKDEAQQLQKKYMRLYFKEPNELDIYCGNIQGFLGGYNTMKYINLIAKSLPADN